MKVDWTKIQHFTQKEFDSKGAGEKGTGANMDHEFMELLDSLRDRLGRPVRISSGFRTKTHNAATGGKPNSAHLKGLAADIVVKNDRERFEIVDMALALGFHRIGIANGFVHVDTSTTLPTPRIWTY